jgi:ABC-type multidrug transport system fused ATPase/permease subunit
MKSSNGKKNFFWILGVVMMCAVWSVAEAFLIALWMATFANHYPTNEWSTHMFWWFLGIWLVLTLIFSVIWIGYCLLSDAHADRKAKKAQR